ncbi:hypothetical protein [Devosia sp. A449]
MSFSTTSRRRLGLLAFACLSSVVLPAGTALAQKTKTKSPPAVEATTAPAPAEIAVDIPSIDAVGSNVDEATLRAIFSGNLVDNADALAGLTATSITIPEITLQSTTTIDGQANEASVTFSDLVLSDITDGMAASVSLAGMSVAGMEDATASFGPLTASSFNIAGVLSLYGLVEADGSTEIETIYTDFNFAGGSFEAPEIKCSIGPMSVGEFKARPLNYSLAEIMALAETLEAQDDDPSPETIGTALRMYVDIFTAFESSPAKFGGIDCAGTDDAGQPMKFAIAGMTMGGMSPGIYPAISMDGLDITVEDDGTVQVGNMTIKEMDLTGPIATIEAAPAALDEAWFTANARALVPAFGGFSFSDVLVDVPDSEDIGARIKASIGAFDLSLSDYFNGVPTAMVLSASNIIAELPTDTDDEQIQQLIALGVTSVDAGFKIDTAWNAADDTIALNEFSVSGVDLATINLAGTLTNATAALFDLDEDAALAAAMGLAISHLKLDITDTGLSDIIMASVAAEQGSDPAAMRPVFAGLAQGTVISLLAGAAEAQKVGAALNSFVSGTAKYLSIEMTAKQAPGLGLMDFIAAEDDPTALIGKVTIDATAK